MTYTFFRPSTTGCGAGAEGGGADEVAGCWLAEAEGEGGAEGDSEGGADAAPVLVEAGGLLTVDELPLQAARRPAARIRQRSKATIFFGFTVFSSYKFLYSN